MFFPASRYWNLPTYTAKLTDGRTVSAITLPVRAAVPLLGFHPRDDGDRLDLVAARYLKDPAGFWRLCDANDSFAPDALAQRPLIGIPTGGSG
jgi:hypothetical protein